MILFFYNISFKTFLDQYSKENNTVYCIADTDSRTAQYSSKRLPKDSKPFPTKFKYSHNAKYVCKHFGKQKKSETESESNYI